MTHRRRGDLFQVTRVQRCTQKVLSETGGNAHGSSLIIHNLWELIRKYVSKVINLSNTLCLCGIRHWLSWAALMPKWVGWFSSHKTHSHYIFGFLSSIFIFFLKVRIISIAGIVSKTKTVLVRLSGTCCSIINTGCSFNTPHSAANGSLCFW